MEFVMTLVEALVDAKCKPAEMGPKSMGAFRIATES